MSWLCAVRDRALVLLPVVVLNAGAVSWLWDLPTHSKLLLQCSLCTLVLKASLLCAWPPTTVHVVAKLPRWSLHFQQIQYLH